MPNQSSQNGDIYITKNRSVLSQWLHGKSVAKDRSKTFRMADVVQEGYLLKQGTRLKMWTRRYFILRLEERYMTLGYYNSREDLTLCNETPIGPGHRLFDRSCSKHPHRMELRCGSQILVLDAEDSHSFTQWKTALEEAVRWNDTMVSSGGQVVTYGKKTTDDQQEEERKKAEELKKMKEKKQKEQANRPKYLPATREGNQCFMSNNARFDIPLKYKYTKTIGSGAYGVVIAVEDTELNRQVAIKNIQRAFDDLTDAKRIVREIRLMRHMNHKHILGVSDILQPPSISNFEDVYIVSDLMATDLHRVIYSRHALSDEHVAYFMYQMLCALKYMHSANVIHRDLKPSNILLNGNCELKICDFGLARGIFPDEEAELTEYVVTRWYRAPEIMLGCMKYTKDVDVWSLGCMFAEMIARKPLFPGQDYIDQLHLIMNVLGAPSDQDLYFLTNARARKFMNAEYHKRGEIPTKPLSSIFKDINPDALDLMSKMLIIDPNKRISVDEALAHPYLASIRCPEDETVCGDVFNFDFETGKLTKQDLQRLIWEDMCFFHPEARTSLPNQDGATPPPPPSKQVKTSNANQTSASTLSTSIGTTKDSKLSLNQRESTNQEDHEDNQMDNDEFVGPHDDESSIPLSPKNANHPDKQHCLDGKIEVAAGEYP